MSTTDLAGPIDDATIALLERYARRVIRGVSAVWLSWFALPLGIIALGVLVDPLGLALLLSWFLFTVVILRPNFSAETEFVLETDRSPVAARQSFAAACNPATAFPMATYRHHHRANEDLEDPPDWGAVSLPVTFSDQPPTIHTRFGADGDHFELIRREHEEAVVFALVRDGEPAWRATVQFRRIDNGTAVRLITHYPWCNLQDLLGLLLQRLYEGRIFERFDYRITSRDGSITYHGARESPE